jgi:hypothetical protein
MDVDSVPPHRNLQNAMLGFTELRLVIEIFNPHGLSFFLGFTELPHIEGDVSIFSQKIHGVFLVGPAEFLDVLDETECQRLFNLAAMTASQCFTRAQHVVHQVVQIFWVCDAELFDINTVATRLHDVVEPTLAPSAADLAAVLAVNEAHLAERAFFVANSATDMPILVASGVGEVDFGGIDV